MLLRPERMGEGGLGAPAPGLSSLALAGLGGAALSEECSCFWAVLLRFWSLWCCLWKETENASVADVTFSSKFSWQREGLGSSG